MSKTDTWMPLYIGDYKRDTAHLGAAEHGAYLLLIMHHWVTQAPLPDSDKQLARIACMDQSEWLEIRPIIQPFFDLGNDGWTHPRVVRELAAAAKRSEAARAKAGKRWSPDAGADAAASPQHDRGTPSAPELETPEHNPRTCSSPSSGSPNHKSQSLPSEAPPPLPIAKFSDAFPEVIEGWNALAHDVGLSKISTLTDARKKSLGKRLTECGGISGWNIALAKIRGSPFLTGDNDRGWKADFDFVLQPSSFTKLMEGGYDAKPRTANPAKTGNPTQESDRRELLEAFGLSAGNEGMGGDAGPEGPILDGEYRRSH